MKLKQPRSRMQAAPRRLKPAPKLVDEFYLSSEWRALASRLKRERGYRCEAVGCGADWSTEPGKLIGDHIVERRDGGADLDPANIQILCLDCHNTKTASARRARQAEL